MLSLTFQVAATIFTLGSLWLAGHKNRWSPVLGLVGQIPWLLLMQHDGLWGLLPLNIAVTCLHARNVRLWWFPASGRTT